MSELGPGDRRWAAGVEYLGQRYHGWQIQPHARSVQAEVERALAYVADHTIHTVAAGRTDAGVHALCQVIHFDSAARRESCNWVLGANTRLPPDVSLRWVEPVSPLFHARYSARARRYRYLIHNVRARSALLSGRVTWLSTPLDAQKMQRSAQCLLGQHDFNAFRGAACEARSSVREVHSLSITRQGDFVTLDIRANAFLLHMVRNIAGSLMEVGMGRRSESWMAEVLAGTRRSAAGKTAESDGLYFLGAEYPSELAIPQPPEFWLP